MRIAQLSTPFISVPPKTYGGIELVVYYLTQELVKRGHQVTLFAPGDSQTDAELISAYPKPLDKKHQRELFSPLATKLFWLNSLPTLYHLVACLERQQQFDIIHNHLHYLPLLFAPFIKTPIVHTYHGDFASAIKSPIEQMVLRKYQSQPWIAISESQKRSCPIKLHFVATIHHGVDIYKFSFSHRPDDYLIWLGRVTAKKGIKEAIEVAKVTRHRLVLAAFINPRDRGFFEKKIRPEIDNREISFVGEINQQQKVKLLQNARAILYPIGWEEPFGLVMIEAMACGTPVIAYNRGSVAEIVVDQETGYIVNSKLPGSYLPGGQMAPRKVEGIIKESGINGLCQAVERIYSLPAKRYSQMRQACRAQVEKHFTIETMVAKYQKIYQKICLQSATESNVTGS